MKTKLPNFLIVGVAKSGTTSLYQYLKQHPEVYMCPVKEPKFITAQFLEFPLQGKGDERIERNIIKNFSDYKNLFKKVGNEKAVGEASVDNLYYYDKAIKYIKEYLGDIKIIIILRNPIERAFSQYLMFRNHREYLSFESALGEEEERKRKNWEFFWYYKDVGFYYKSVKAYTENFSRVKIYLYDDLKNNPLGLMNDVYKFLKVDTSFTPDIGVKYNISGVPKHRMLYDLVYKSNQFKDNMVKPVLNLFLTEGKRKQLKEKLKAKLIRKSKMKLETREYLKDTYRNDILSLQELLGRNLSQWLN